MGKIAEKAICGSVFLTIWHCILSAELTKMHSSRLFFGDFARWEARLEFEASPVVSHKNRSHGDRF